MTSTYQIQIALAMMALILWSELILIWLYRTRIPAMKELKKGKELPSKNQLPEQIKRIAHNYNHLMEQPVLFYSLCLLTISLNIDSSLNIYFAWIYVVLRIVHSIYQIYFNYIPYRFILFSTGSISLMLMSVNSMNILTGLL